MRCLFVLLILLAHVLSYRIYEKEFVLKIRVAIENLNYSYTGVRERIISHADAMRFELLPQGTCINLIPSKIGPPRYCYLKDPDDGSYYPPKLKADPVRSRYYLHIEVELNELGRIFLSEQRAENCDSTGSLKVEFNLSNQDVLDRISHKNLHEPQTKGNTIVRDVSLKNLPDQYKSEKLSQRNIFLMRPFDLTLKVEYEAVGFGPELSYVHAVGSPEEVTYLKTLEMDGSLQVELAPRTCVQVRTFANVRIIELRLYYLNDLRGSAASVWEKYGIFWREERWFAVDVRHIYRKRFMYAEKVRVLAHTSVQVLLYHLEDCKCNGDAFENSDEDFMP